MTSKRHEGDDRIERHLEAALECTADETARYHIREALQLRIAEKTDRSRQHG